MNDFQTWIALYKESYEEQKLKINILLVILALIALVFFAFEGLLGLVIFASAFFGALFGIVFTHFILYLFWRHNGIWEDLKNEHFNNDVK